LTTRRIDGDHGPAMEDAGSTLSAERFDAVRSAFATARRRAAHDCRVAHYVIGDQTVRLRIVGERLAQCVQAPLAHLRASDNAGAAALTIELWDERATGVSGASRAHHAVGRTWAVGDGGFAPGA